MSWDCRSNGIGFAFLPQPIEMKLNCLVHVAFALFPRGAG